LFGSWLPNPHLCDAPMKKISPLRITLATVAVALCAGMAMAAVTGISYLYGNGQTDPNTTLAGRLGVADGGVISIVGAPIPTDAGQVLTITVPGRNGKAEWKAPAAGGTTLAPTTPGKWLHSTGTQTGSNTSTNTEWAALPAATTTAAGVVKLDPNSPQPDGVAAPGNGGMASDSLHVHPVVDVPGGTYWIWENEGDGLLARSPNASVPSDTKTVTITSSSSKTDGTLAQGFYLGTDDPRLVYWPGGTLRVSLQITVSAATATLHVDWGRFAGPGHALILSDQTVGTTGSASYVTVSAGFVLPASTGLISDSPWFQVWATTTSGSAVTVTMGVGSTHPSYLNTPYLKVGFDLTGYQAISERGIASGYAPLDPNAVVPTANMGTGTPYQGRILTACGGTGSVDTSVTCSASAWVNPPPVISVDTVTPTPIIPRTGTSTGTNTYPAPALHSHTFGVNAAQVGDLPTMQSAGSTSAATDTNTNPATVIVMGHPPIGSINGLQAALDGKQPTVSGISGQAAFFSSGTDTSASTGTSATTSLLAGWVTGRLLAVTVLTTTATATNTSNVYTPTAGTQMELIEYLGAGGGAGACQGAFTMYGATGGGAAGEYAFVRHYPGGFIAPWNYYCGKAGAAGATSTSTSTSTSANGVAGGDTVLVLGGTTYTAKGGLGSGFVNENIASAGLSLGGSGQTHSGGGTPLWSFRGASGGTGIGISRSQIVSGAGAASPFGVAGNLGIITAISDTAQAGASSSGFGAGGTGCAINYASAVKGADGTPGVIIVRDFM
jgi:hypothetical protein